MFLECIKNIEKGEVFREILYNNSDGIEQIMISKIQKEIAQWDDRNQNKGIKQLLNIILNVQIDFELIYKELIKSFVWKRGELQKVLIIFIYSRLFYYTEKNILKQENNILGIFVREKLIGINRDNLIEENDNSEGTSSTRTSTSLSGPPRSCNLL